MPDFKGLTIEFGGNTTKLSSALQSIRKDANSAQRELKQIERAMQFNPGSSRLATQQIRLLEQRCQSAKKELDALNKAAADGPDSMSAEQWDALQAEIAIAENKVKNFSDALSQAYVKMDASQSALGRAGLAIEQFGNRHQTAAKNLTAVGGVLTRTLTPAILAGGAASVAAAVDIDTSLTNVRKTVDGTEEDYQRLKQSAIEFSKTNAVSASQVLDIQSLGAQLGFTIDELDEFGRVVSGLDIATNMDAQTAGTELAQFANITKMAHGDISRYGSAIVELGNNFATTEKDVSSMAMRIAAAGTQVGMSQADILGLATALSSMGIEAEAGGTAISTIMSQIDKDVATNSASLDTWASTAQMSAEQFANAWRTNPVEALAAVLSGMEQATQEGGNMSLMLQELGVDSLRQTDVMKRLAGNSELVGQAVSTANQAWQENSALQAEVDNRNESLSAKFEMLKNRVVAIAEQIGGPLANALLDVIDAAEPLIQAIADGAQAFADMDKSQQQAILGAVGLAAALGPMLTGFGKLIGFLPQLGQGVQSVAQFFAKLGGAGNQAKNGVNGVSGALGKLSKSAGISATAMGGLATGIAGLSSVAAIVAITAIGNAIANEKKRIDDFTDATVGLDRATRNIPAGADAASLSLDNLGGAAESSAKSVEEILESQAELAKSMSERNAAAGEQIGNLKAYQQTIEELGGRSDLTAEEVAMLKLAVDGLNDATGSSYSVAQDAGGAYQIMKDGAAAAKDEIYNLIEAKMREIEIDNAADNYAEAKRQQADDYKSLTAKIAEKNAIEQRQQELQAKGAQLTNEERSELNGYGSQLEQINRDIDLLSRAYDESGSKAQAWKDTMLLGKMALDENADAYTKLIGNNEDLRAALADSGYSALTFRDQLEQLGANSEQLAALTPTQWAEIAAAYKGNIDSIIPKLQEFGIGMSDAALQTQANADQMRNSASVAMAEINGAFLGIQGGKDAFVQSMADAGVSVSDFASLTPEQMAQVAEAYKTNIDQAIAMLQQFAQDNATYGQQSADNLNQGVANGAQQVPNTFASMDAQAAANASMPQTNAVFNEATMQWETMTQDGVTRAVGPLNQFGPLGAAAVQASGGQINAAASSAVGGMALAMMGVLPSVQTAGLMVGPAYGGGVLASAGAAQGSGTAVAAAGASGAQSATGQYQAAGAQGGQQYSGGVRSAQGAARSSAQTVGNSAVSALSALNARMSSTGRAGGTNYAVGVGSAAGSARAAGSSVATSAIGGMSGMASAAYSAGLAVGNAFSDGVAAGAASGKSLASSGGGSGTVKIGAQALIPIMPVPASEASTHAVAYDGMIAPMAATVDRAFTQLAKINAFSLGKSIGSSDGNDVTSATTYNVYIDGARINDTPQIEDCVFDLIQEAYRQNVMMGGR